MKAFNTINKLAHIREDDREFLANFTHGSDPKVNSPAFQTLSDGVKAAIQYCDYFEKHGASLQQMGIGLPSGSDHTLVVGVNPFLKNLASALGGENRDKLLDSIPLLMVQSLLARLGGAKNSKLPDKLRAFESIIWQQSPTAARWLQKNAAFSLSERHIRRLNATLLNDKSVVINEDVEAIEYRVLHNLGATSDDSSALVCGAFDGSILVPVASTMYVETTKYAVGGVYPHHFRKVVDGADTADCEKIALAREAKTFLLTTQNPIDGVFPSRVIAVRPTSVNSPSESFTANCVTGTRRSGCALVSLCFDGVSTEANTVREGHFKFLLGQSSIAYSTDVNHNFKNIRSHAVYGSSSMTIGNTPIDFGVLLSNEGNSAAPINCIQVKDFASDALVARLGSPDVIDNIKEEITPSNSLSVTAVSLYLFFLRMGPLAMNSVSLRPLDRICYMWSSLIFFYCVEGLPATTKGNHLAQVFAGVFLCGIKDFDPRRSTTEPLEHLFGNLRTIQREFDVMWMVRHISKMESMLNNVMKHGLSTGNSSTGYSATFPGYLDALSKFAKGKKRKDATSFDFNDDSIAVAIDGTKPWAHLVAPKILPLLNKVNDLMKGVLLRFGVKEKDFPAFAQGDIQSLDHLASLYYHHQNQSVQKHLRRLNLVPPCVVCASPDRHEGESKSSEDEVAKTQSANQRAFRLSRSSGDSSVSVDFCDEEDMYEEEALDTAESDKMREKDALNSELSRRIIELSNIDTHPIAEAASKENDIVLEDDDDKDENEKMMTLQQNLLNDRPEASRESPSEAGSSQEPPAEAAKPFSDVAKVFGHSLERDDVVFAKSTVGDVSAGLPRSRIQGSTSDSAKYNSRHARWFGVKRGDDVEEVEDDDEVSADGKHICRGDIIKIRDYLYLVTSVYQKKYGKYIMEPRIAGGPNTVVHATLGQFGGDHNRFYEPLSPSEQLKFPLKEVYVVLKGVTVNQLYDPTAPIPIPQASTSAVVQRPQNTVPLLQPFKVGDRVLAKWTGSRDKFKGFIVKINGTGTCHIKFDDNAEDLAVPFKSIKRCNPVIFEVRDSTCGM